MKSVHLKIRAGVAKLEEAYISDRIRSILGETGAACASVTGSFLQDYQIRGIPDKALDAVLSRMGDEPGFEPYPYKA